MNPILPSTPDNGVPPGSTAPPASFGDDERILLDTLASGLRPRYLSAKAPSLVALMNISAGVPRWGHPDFAAPKGIPTACTGRFCPLCAAGYFRWFIVAAPVINLEQRTPGLLELRYQIVSQDRKLVRACVRKSLEEAVALAWPGGTAAVAVKVERDDRGWVSGRLVTPPPELAYPADLADLFWSWFQGVEADIARLIVTEVDPAEIRKDPRLTRRLAASRL